MSGVAKFQDISAKGMAVTRGGKWLARMAAACVALWAAASPAAAEDRAAPAPIEVMVVGTFHFANPGLDYRNVAVDDVLQPARQKEIAAIVQALARFAPTAVGVEWRETAAADAYARYRAGTLPPSREEAVQLGFALARARGLETVHGLDMPMSLPFEPVFAYAKAHGGEAIIDRITAVSERNVAAQESTLKTGGIAATLRLLNGPAADDGHALYREVLKLGAGSEQPGLDATAAWYRRNLGICARLLQVARPGDRVAVFFGGGHLTLLRQCVAETPGYRLVDPLPYLPR
jgi:hypothetical protein